MAGCSTVEDIAPQTSIQVSSYVYALWGLAGICTLISAILSTGLIWKHTLYYRKPEQQRHIIRILLMVPIYSFCSFLSLVFSKNSLTFDAIRSTYEAFVIYSFFSLLLNYLGPDLNSQKLVLQNKKNGHYPFPLLCMQYNPRKSYFLLLCIRGTLQYALIHPFTSIIEVSLEAVNLLCPGNFSPSYPSFWLGGIEIISVTIAMYFLVFFYLVVREDIKRFNPVQKMLAIKFVLFFSFWQSILLSFLASEDVITATGHFNKSEITNQIQNSLICIEMVIASIWHVYCFNVDEYEGERMDPVHGMRDVVFAKDLLDDTKHAMLNIDKKQKDKNEKVQLEHLQRDSSVAIMKTFKNQNDKTPLIKEADISDSRNHLNSLFLEADPDLEEQGDDDHLMK